MNQQFTREQKAFGQRIEVLQRTIVELNQKSLVQNRKIQLTLDLEKTLLTRKPQLGNMLFKLYYELFELLANNNMLRP